MENKHKISCKKYKKQNRWAFTLLTRPLLTIVLLGMPLDKHCHPSGFSNLNLHYKNKVIKLYNKT